MEQSSHPNQDPGQPLVGLTFRLGAFLLVTKKQVKNKKPGPSGNQVNSKCNAIEGATEMTLKTLNVTTLQRNCSDCDEVFPSHRSLAMHRHHRHPVKVNAGNSTYKETDLGCRGACSTD